MLSRGANARSVFFFGSKLVQLLFTNYYTTRKTSSRISSTTISYHIYSTHRFCWLCLATSTTAWSHKLYSKRERGGGGDGNRFKEPHVMICSLATSCRTIRAHGNVSYCKTRLVLCLQRCLTYISLATYFCHSLAAAVFLLDKVK